MGTGAWALLAMPDAPRLDAVDAQGNAVFQSVDEHSAAMALSGGLYWLMLSAVQAFGL